MVLTPSSSFASEINDAGAKRLESMFATLLNEQKAKTETHGGTLTTQDNIVVEQASDYYAITLPAFTITNKDGTGTQIGLIAINATPTKNPDNWNLSIALPTPLKYLNKNGNIETQINIGTQRMNGLWDGELKTFSKLAAQYDDIKITRSNNLSTITVDKINVLTSLDVDKENLWSIRNKIKLRGLNVNHPTFNEFIPSDINLNINLDKLPLLQIMEIIKNITANSGNVNVQKIQILSAMLSLPQIFGDAGMTFNIVNSNFKNDLYDIKLNSDFHSNSTSILGATGELDANIKGLKETIKELEKKKKSVEESHKLPISIAIQKLKMLQKAAQKNGDIHKIKLTLDENAKLLINSKDINEVASQSK
jgi:hypothetical protein